MHALTLLLGDGRFPGGGHAHSGGLEAAVASGTVADLDSLRDFLVGRLTTAGAVDAWCAAVACAGADAALVEAEYEARCPSPALRAAGRAQGRGLKRAAARSWPVVGECPAEQHAVVLGFAARAAGLSPSEAASLALHAALMGTAAAAVRLLPIDMADAAAAVASLAPMADEIALPTSPSSKSGPANGHERSDSTDLERFSGEASLGDGPAWSAPALELLAEEHARWEVRLFAS
jgi:urease accessory protein